jgi:hypothetical protein
MSVRFSSPLALPPRKAALQSSDLAEDAEDLPPFGLAEWHRPLTVGELDDAG